MHIFLGGLAMVAMVVVDLPVEVAQLVIRQRVIVRVPTRPALPAGGAQTEWRERRGPKCVAMAGVRAAAIVREDSVDLILKGGTRLRARFERSCPDLDYYSGFYIRPGPDGRICADRDSVHSRAGGECQITRFRTLVPSRRQDSRKMRPKDDERVMRSDRSVADPHRFG